MYPYLIEMLECPACHHGLTWQIIEQNKTRIETAEAICNNCQASYPVREGIGLFLTPDLPRNDLWDQVDSGLVKYLRQHPDLEQQLLETPLHDLNPADQFFRALMLESKGKFTEAKEAVDTAFRGLYTPDYNECWASQVAYLLEELPNTEGPIIDLASGRGYLVEKIIRQTERQVVATDFSPAILRRNRKYFEYFGLYEQISLLCFDARRTPFKDGVVQILTTNLGLPNIENPAHLVKELRRIVGKSLLAISHFFSETDTNNAETIKKLGLGTMLYKSSALSQFAKAGWPVELSNICLGQAHPTPASVILEGTKIDGLPAASTQLEWALLVGKIQ